jgi:hypothetical protein
MRKGLLGSIATLTLGVGAAWGQGGPPAPAAIGMSTVGSGVVQANNPVPEFTPLILPQMPGVPPGGPPIDMGNESGPAAQPPVPMYPPPGPYGAPLFQAAPQPPVADGSVIAPHYWSNFEYLVYFPRSLNVPFPLLTSSAPNDNGVIGLPSTVNLVPAGRLPYNATSGFRTTVGFFGDDDRRFGAEVVGFALEQKSNIQGFFTQAGGTPTLARPFVDSTGNLSSSVVVGNLFYGSGSAEIAARTQTWGMEGMGVFNLYRTRPENLCQFSLDFLAGYRFLNLTEELSVTTLTQVTVPPSTTAVITTDSSGNVLATSSYVVTPIINVGGTQVTIPGAIVIQDMVQVRNRFNGGQAGLRGFFRYGMFSFTATGKVAIGSMRQTVDISGITGEFDAVRGFTGGNIGGVLANSSNIGRYSNDEYAVIPEVNLAVGVNLSRCCTATMGYNLLYMNHIVRPGSVINPVVNNAQIPASSTYGNTGTTPTITDIFSQQSTMLLHGLSFGLTWKY